MEKGAKNMGMSNKAIGGLVIAVIAAMIVGVAGAKVLLAAPAVTGIGGAPVVQTISPICNPEATGNLAPELRFELTNPLNTAKENKIQTVRVYEVAASTDASTSTQALGAGYVGTVDTSGSGLIADGSGWECGCDQAYLLVSTRDQPANMAGTGNTSTAFTMVCTKNDNTVIKSGSTQTPDLGMLRAKVYDNDARAYLYTNETGDGGTSAGTWLDLSIYNSSTYSTTAGAWQTQPTIATDGFLDYTITVQTNSSTATDTQFNDQSLLITIDLQSEDDWAEPTTLNFDGENLLNNEVDCPTKISNLGYDYCYTSAKTIKTTAMDLDIYVKALSGVNPDDDVEIGFFTSGWVASTIDNSAKVAYADDSPSKALVYLGNNITLLAA